MFEN